MNIPSLERSSKNVCINYENARNNITSKLTSNHQKLKQCCLNIAARQVIIRQPNQSSQPSCNQKVYNEKEIIKAVKNGNTSYLEEFLTKNPPYVIDKVYNFNPNYDRYTLLNIAVLNNQFNTVKYLVEKGANLDCYPNLFMTACRYGLSDQIGKDDIVHYLLTQGVKLPENYDDIIFYCMDSGKKKTFQTLVYHGILPTFDKNISNINYYLEPQNIKYLRCLLENNFKVDKEYNDLQLIHIACKHLTPSVEVIKLLLEYGANPNAQSKSGKATPLHFLLAHKNLLDLCDIVKFLVANGADDSLKGKINSMHKIRDISEQAKKIITENYKCNKYRAIELVPNENKNYLQGIIQYHKKDCINNKTSKKQKTAVNTNQPTKQSLFSRLKDKFKVPSAHPLKDEILPENSLDSNFEKKIVARYLKGELQAPPAYDEIDKK
jgi:ankyrin repeat protein